MLHLPVIIIIQYCQHALNTYGAKFRGLGRYLSDIFCRDSKLQLILSITYLFCNIWVFYVNNWPRRYIHESLYYYIIHNQIESISLSRFCYIFSGCVAVGYTIIFCQLFYMDPGKSGFLFSLHLPLQSKMCVNNWAYYGLKIVIVCVHKTLYHHYYADTPENIENIK